MQTNPSTQTNSNTEQVPMISIQENQQMITNEGIPPAQEQIPIINQSETIQTVVVVRPGNNVNQQDPNEYFRSQLQSPDESCCCGIKCCECCNLWVGAHIWILYFLIIYIYSLIVYFGILIVLMDEYNTHTLPHDQCSVTVDNNVTPDNKPCDEREQYENNGMTVGVVITEIIVMVIGIIINIFACYGLYTNYKCAFITELCWIGVTIIFVIIYMIMTGLLTGVYQLILDAWAFYVFYMVWKWSNKSNQSVTN